MFPNRGFPLKICFLSFITAALLIGCSRLNPVELDASDNGSDLELQRGQFLSITLPSNPSTGYSWVVTQINETILEQVGEPSFQQADSQGTPLVGAGGEETLKFRAVGGGTTTLILGYRRPWEQDVDPIESFTLEINVP